MDKAPTATQVLEFTRKKLDTLVAENVNQTKAFAQLRRGIGKQPGEVPQLWGYFLQDMPESFYGQKEASRAEWAVYTALTLYALHQQGKNVQTDCMNKEGNTLGTALNLLVQKTEAKDAMERRFQSVATATQMKQLSNHMRAIVQLLRAENIPLDYPCLAKDLYLYQFPQAVSSIRLRWGQDFYSVKLPE